MITGTTKALVDSVWNTMWTGGISNPQTVMEQLTLLLFLRGLDDTQTKLERQARASGTEVKRIFPEGRDAIPILDGQGREVAPGRDYADLRWTRFVALPADDMQEAAENHLIPFLRQIGTDGSALRKHMAGVRYEIPTGRVLAKVVDLLNQIEMKDRDAKGDLYEYMLSRVAAAGENGQFRTPRHIIQLMVAMMDPRRNERIVDPAAGTCGFLVEASEYLRREDPNLFHDDAARSHFLTRQFVGHDFDGTMLRLGAMNMALHGLEDADVTYRDALTEAHGDEAEAYDLILANPPFAGSLDRDAVAKDLLREVQTGKTELLFLALFLRLLKRGGRAAVIVPDGVLFGASKAHKAIREKLVKGNKLEGVVKLPSGVFKPYSGVSTAILLFQRTDSGGTDHVWFYDLRADGMSLDDKRTPLLPDDKLGPWAELTEAEGALNDLPDALLGWSERDGDERGRSRTERSFCVPFAEIEAAGWDLSLNRYREVEHTAEDHRPVADILADLRAAEAEIAEGLGDLEAMLARPAETAVTEAAE
jgi:type I restriction enzyme M protein